MHYRVNPAGQVVLDGDGLFELWFHGGTLDGVSVIGDEEIDRFNEQCRSHGKDDHMVSTDTAEPPSHQERSSKWLIPDAYKEIDVEAYCLDRCQDEDQRARVRQEMILFKARSLAPMLQSLVYLVDTLRTNNVLWGVGRGSSVASYVLYLLGVHRIDPMKFDLKIEEFLRD